jgi:hypothetical protein
VFGQVDPLTVAVGGEATVVETASYEVLMEPRFVAVKTVAPWE